MRIVCLECVSPADKHAIIELLGAGDFKAVLWDWQFHECVGERTRTLIIAYDDTDKVIGFNGSIPVTVQMAGTNHVALWSCDFIVSATCRGQGIGHKLKQDLLKRADLVMALGLSAAADRVHASMGWKRGPSVRSFTRLHEMRDIRAAVKVVAQHAQSIWLRFRDPGQRASLSTSVVSLDALAQEAQQLWEKVRASYDNIVVRDWAYLKWRYARHPSAWYRAICVRSASGELEGVGIFWLSERRAVLVDYVGPRRARSIKDSIVRCFVHECRHAPLLECSTTDEELQDALAMHGFVNWRNRAAAFNYYQPSPGPEGEWFLMGGDSDGDILEAGRSADEFRVEHWDEATFLSSRTEWSDLLSRSTADRLFLSWEWQAAWWTTFARAHGLQLRCLAVRNRAGRLVGIAPMYVHAATQRNVASRRLQFIGNIWRGPSTMRTEYLEFVLDERVEAEVARTICSRLIEDSSWDDLVLTDLRFECATRTAVETTALAEHCYLRTGESYTGYGIEVRGSFEQYVRGLSASRRRKLFQQRHKLDKLGTVKLVSLGSEDFLVFAPRMDRLHACRWGKPFFVDRLQQFHERLIADLPEGARAHLSILQVGTVDLSAAYNIRVGTREYNLQGGFDENAVRGVSLGLVHTGYLIEEAFKDGIECLDLLVGGGKQHNFKERIADIVMRTSTLHVVRSPLLQASFRVHDALKAQRRR